jgi:hypothetical protein
MKKVHVFNNNKKIQNFKVQPTHALPTIISSFPFASTSLLLAICKYQGVKMFDL